jgi:hypothetical protein
VKRTLTLRREPLADLTTTELAEVQAGALETLLHYCVFLTVVEPSSPIRCLTRGHTCINCE